MQIQPQVRLVGPQGPRNFNGGIHPRPPVDRFDRAEDSAAGLIPNPRAQEAEAPPAPPPAVAPKTPKTPQEWQRTQSGLAGIEKMLADPTLPESTRKSLNSMLKARVQHLFEKGSPEQKLELITKFPNLIKGDSGGATIPKDAAGWNQALDNVGNLMNTLDDPNLTPAARAELTRMLRERMAGLGKGLGPDNGVADGIQSRYHALMSRLLKPPGKGVGMGIPPGWLNQPPPLPPTLTEPPRLPLPLPNGPEPPRLFLPPPGSPPAMPEPPNLYYRPPGNELPVPGHLFDFQEELR